MNKFKHIFAIFIVLCILTTAAYLFPKTGLDKYLPKADKEQAETVVDTTAAVQDTTPFIDRMKQDLKVIQSERKRKRDLWTLGKGRTITYYLLQAQRFLNKNGGKVLYMEELFNNSNAFQSAKLDALSPEGDTLNLTLLVSSNIFHDNASYLTVAFQVTKLTPELIATLNELDYPYDLLVTPFGMQTTFFPDLDRIKNKELVLWLFMEDRDLNLSHTKYRPIRIHQKEEEIENIITEAKTLVPTARGIATRFAKQAMEHKALLQAVLSATQKNGLWFADLSLNKKSKVMDICQDNGISCKIFSPYNPSNSTLDDYIHQKLRGAFRSGMGAMILPLSMESLAKVKSLKEKTAGQGTTIINLSTFMNTNKEFP